MRLKSLLLTGKNEETKQSAIKPWLKQVQLSKGPPEGNN